MTPTPTPILTEPIRPQITVVGYIRASTPQQRSSVVAQYETIRAHCQSYGFALAPDIVRTITLDDGTTTEITGCFVDAGVSAESVDFLCREDASAMLLHMREHGIRDIIGTKGDRVFRDVDDGRASIRELAKHRMRMTLLDMGGVAVTFENAAGLFIFTIMIAVGEFDNGRRKERVRDCNDMNRRRREETGTGVFLGSAPYGMDKAPHPTDPKKSILVRNEFEHAIRERILHGDLSKVSDNEAARQLTNAGIPTKNGGKWYGATVASIRKTAQKSAT